MPGTTGEGPWLGITNGITVDSGSAAFVMPTSWLPGLPVQESPGSKRGQKFVGATGRTVANDGQKELKFLTDDGKGRRFKMQCGDVNKCLGSVGGITDAENFVIFHRNGGWIVPEKHTTIILPKDKALITDFKRHGMVYRMDAWVKRSEVQKDVKMKDVDFRRHVGR